MTRRYVAIVTDGANLATRAYAPHGRPNGLDSRPQPAVGDVLGAGAARSSGTLAGSADVPLCWWAEPCGGDFVRSIRRRHACSERSVYLGIKLLDTKANFLEVERIGASSFGEKGRGIR